LWSTRMPRQPDDNQRVRALFAVYLLLALAAPARALTSDNGCTCTGSCGKGVESYNWCYTSNSCGNSGWTGCANNVFSPRVRHARRCTYCVPALMRAYGVLRTPQVLGLLHAGAVARAQHARAQHAHHHHVLLVELLQQCMLKQRNVHQRT
jgi:hypothetical protein